MIADAATDANQFAVSRIETPGFKPLRLGRTFRARQARVRNLIPSATWGERIMHIMLAIAAVMALGAALIYRSESRRGD